MRCLNNRIGVANHLLFAVFVIFFAACSQDDTKQFSNIYISWELDSNARAEYAASLSTFTLKNNSNKTIIDNGWELYFNQAAREIKKGDNEYALVERISGDWYRIIPKPGFKLKPGESIEISYETDYWLTKLSDSPMGLYFVLTDLKGDTKTIEVENFSILPFERPEQIQRSKIDFEPLPTPENDFERNKNLFKIDESEQLQIIPSPKDITVNTQTAKFSDGCTIICEDEKLENEAQYLISRLKEMLGWEVKLDIAKAKKERGNAIYLYQDNETSKNKEGYRLNVKNNSIVIEGTSNSGVFYGIQSLLSLISAKQILSKAKEIDLPIINVNDAPRFDYRGIHIDVARNFQTKETIKKIIDILAHYKINRLHIHLTDDEGWRLEIADLPELTAIGGKRMHTTKESKALHPSYGSGPVAFANGSYGSGFYSRADYIDILKYAKQRHINVIPEINMPGHSRAAIKAMEARYQHFLDKGDNENANKYRLIDPDEKSVYRSAQYFNDNVVNVARESVYNFFEVVVDEIISMYKDADAQLEIVHVGGDEVPRGAWTKSPMVDELMKHRPDIKHYENMHAYFTERIVDIMTKKNLKIAGWEEVALHTDNGHKVNPRFANGNVIPYVWNSLWGAQDLAYRLANKGYPVVMCHVTNFYFDLAYSNHPNEPGLYWGGYVNTYSAWHYNPFDLFKSTLKDNMGRPIDTEIEYKQMERLKPESRKNIMGLQAQLWSETVKGQQMLEYLLLPKLIGFAESAWAKEREWETISDKIKREQQVEKEWNTFANTIAAKELPRLSVQFGGFNYRVSPPGAKFMGDTLYANIDLPGLQIKYTTNGEEPSEESTIYEKPIIIKSATVNLKAFDLAGKSSRTVIVNKQ